MRRIAMMIILALGVGLLSGCAVNRRMLIIDPKTKEVAEYKTSFWGSTTVGFVGKDGNITFYNDDYPYPGSYSEDVTGPDGTKVNRHGSYPGYGYGYGYGYNGQYGRDGTHYDPYYEYHNHYNWYRSRPIAPDDPLRHLK